MGASIQKHSMIDRPGMIDSLAHQSKALGTDNLINILKNNARIDKNSKTK